MQKLLKRIFMHQLRSSVSVESERGWFRDALVDDGLWPEAVEAGLLVENFAGDFLFRDFVVNLDIINRHSLL